MTIKKARLAVETLESRELLAVSVGLAPTPPATFDSIAPPSVSPMPTSDDGVVFLSGTGQSPAPGAASADLTVHLSTSRKIASDFASFSLYVGITADGVATVPVAGFNPAAAGFQIADPQLDTVPDITVTPLFTTNLISNGSWAFYLYADSDDAPVGGAWYLRAVWFDLSLSGDWTSGADTCVGTDLASLRLNFASNW